MCYHVPYEHVPFTSLGYLQHNVKYLKSTNVIFRMPRIYLIIMATTPIRCFQSYIMSLGYLFSYKFKMYLGYGVSGVCDS